MLAETYFYKIHHYLIDHLLVFPKKYQMPISQLYTVQAPLSSREAKQRQISQKRALIATHLLALKFIAATFIDVSWFSLIITLSKRPLELTYFEKKTGVRENSPSQIKLHILKSFLIPLKIDSHHSLMVACLTTNSIFLDLGMEMANSSMINATVGKSSLSIFLEPVCCKKRKKSPSQETGLRNRGHLFQWFLTL
jgi:hypothetical protein